jgi:hypothetical protein
MNKLKYRKIDPKEYFAGIQIPDDWASLEEFTDWYIQSKMPLMIPFDAECIRSDDAVAICIFKKGHYQVEFYIEFSGMYIRKHAHPRMEVIVVELGGGSGSPRDEYGISRGWGYIGHLLKPGEYHGGIPVDQLKNGFVTLAFQRWENIDEMSSAAIQWKGELQGPVQEDLIRRRKKFAEVRPGYADVTNDTSFTKD